MDLYILHVTNRKHNKEFYENKNIPEINTICQLFTHKHPYYWQFLSFSLTKASKKYSRLLHHTRRCLLCICDTFAINTIGIHSCYISI